MQTLQACFGLDISVVMSNFRRCPEVSGSMYSVVATCVLSTGKALKTER